METSVSEKTDVVRFYFPPLLYLLFFFFDGLRLCGLIGSRLRINVCNPTTVSPLIKIYMGSSTNSTVPNVTPDMKR